MFSSISTYQSNSQGNLETEIKNIFFSIASASQCIAKEINMCVLARTYGQSPPEPCPHRASSQAPWRHRESECPLRTLEAEPSHAAWWRMVFFHLPVFHYEKSHLTDSGHLRFTRCRADPIPTEDEGGRKRRHMNGHVTPF